MGLSELMALVLVALFSRAVATFAGHDGLPRPSGFSDAPTTTLSAKPAVGYNGKLADCIWYSWENSAYDPTETKNCSTELWASMNANPSGLRGFEYYAPLDVFYDPAYQQYLCVIGCFAGGVAAAADPLVASSSERRILLVAPAVAPSKPPMTPPPPATLFRPPPPAVLQAPSTVVSPTPLSIMPPTASGPALAPGPAAQTSAANALRTIFVTTLFVLVGAVLVLNL